MITRPQAVKIYKKIRKNTFKVINLLFLNPLNIYLLKKIAVYGYGGDKCLKNGFLPLPVHFYSPVPDISDLKARRVWQKRSDLKGINFNSKNQLSLLRKLGQNYGDECKWPFNPTKNPADFFLDNNGFSFGCAASLHSMIRHFKPKKIIEIGSGNSSKVMAAAILKNDQESRTKTDYTIIDPYPGAYIGAKGIKPRRLIKKGVETVDLKIFENLKANDILFIDSSHSVKIGSDVNFLYLEVLPRLKPGVIIHSHDIALPYEYSSTYALNEEFRQFWTEQYLLQSFLTLNPEFEVLLAMNFIMVEQMKNFRAAFPNYDNKKNQYISGSFWFRRKGQK